MSLQLLKTTINEYADLLNLESKWITKEVMFKAKMSSDTEMKIYLMERSGSKDLHETCQGILVVQ